MNEYRRTVLFLVVLGIVYSYQILIHMRALRMNTSYDRLTKVLRSALNNLRGIVGEGFEDHIFAYSDLGGHVAPFSLSFCLLKQKQSLPYGCWIFVLLVVASALILSRVPLNNNDANFENIKSLIRLNRGNVECSCRSCKRKFQSTGKYSAFTFTRKEGVCCLWLYSFEELSNILLGISDMNLPEKRR